MAKYSYIMVSAALIAHGTTYTTLADLKKQSEELRQQSEEFAQRSAAQADAIDKKQLSASDKKKAKEAVNSSKSSFTKMKDSFTDLVSKFKGYFTKKESEIPADVQKELTSISRRRGELSISISKAEAQLDKELEGDSKGMADRMAKISAGIKNDAEEMDALNKRYKALAAKYKLD